MRVPVIASASLSLVALLTLLPAAVTANFDIYSGSDFAWDTAFETWQIFEAEPSCNDAYSSPLYFNRDDVSGRKYGVRCEGGCNNKDPGDIKTLEMHFGNNPLWHWTIYKDRDYKMYGVDGNVYGRCIVFPSDDYFCAGVAGSRQGVRKFRCLTQFTAKQIKDTWTNDRAQLKALSDGKGSENKTAEAWVA